jgi:hypothetical protein
MQKLAKLRVYYSRLAVTWLRYFKRYINVHAISEWLQDPGALNGRRRCNLRVICRFRTTIRKLGILMVGIEQCLATVSNNWYGFRTR